MVDKLKNVSCKADFNINNKYLGQDMLQESEEGMIMAKE